jgi:hypothetical protein
MYHKANEDNTEQMKETSDVLRGLLHRITILLYWLLLWFIDVLLQRKLINVLKYLFFALNVMS